MTNISPKHRAKLNKENPLSKGTFATLEEMRDRLCNLKLNDSSLPPEEREAVNKICQAFLNM